MVLHKSTVKHNDSEPQGKKIQGYPEYRTKKLCEHYMHKTFMSNLCCWITPRRIITKQTRTQRYYCFVKLPIVLFSSIHCSWNYFNTSISPRQKCYFMNSFCAFARVYFALKKKMKQSNKTRNEFGPSVYNIMTCNVLYGIVEINSRHSASDGRSLNYIVSLIIIIVFYQLCSLFRLQQNVWTQIV